jgi:hypothetical protein
MNCEDFNNLVLDVAREQILEASVRVTALRHADSCERCCVRLEDERRLSSHLHTLAEAMEPLGAAPQINPRVIAIFRSRPRVFRLRTKTRRRKIWVAAAAIVLLIIGLAWQLRNAVFTPGSADLPGAAAIQVREHQNATAALSGLSFKTAKSSSTAKWKAIATHSKTLGSSNPASTRPPVSRVGDAGNEIATDFFSVGDTSAQSLADGGQLFRIQLPRSALMSFGLPVNTDGANQKVKADVLVGSDGIARAIRFVR